MGNDERHHRSVGVENVGVGRDSKIPLSTEESPMMRSPDCATFRVAIAEYDVIYYNLTLCLDAAPQNQSTDRNDIPEYSQLVNQVSHTIEARAWWDIAYVSKRWRPWKTRPCKEA
jgi:hypothetical protein